MTPQDSPLPREPAYYAPLCWHRRAVHKRTRFDSGRLDNARASALLAAWLTRCYLLGMRLTAPFFTGVTSLSPLSS